MEAVQGVIAVVPPTGPTGPRLGDGALVCREVAWGGRDGPSSPRGLDGEGRAAHRGAQRLRCFRGHMALGQRLHVQEAGKRDKG